MWSCALCSVSLARVVVRASEDMGRGRWRSMSRLGAPRIELKLGRGFRGWDGNVRDVEVMKDLAVRRTETLRTVGIFTRGLIGVARGGDQISGSVRVWKGLNVYRYVVDCTRSSNYSFFF